MTTMTTHCTHCNLHFDDHDGETDCGLVDDFFRKFAYEYGGVEAHRRMSQHDTPWFRMVRRLCDAYEVSDFEACVLDALADDFEPPFDPAEEAFNEECERNMPADTRETSAPLGIIVDTCTHPASCREAN